MNKNKGYDILASHMKDTFVNLLKVTNEQIIEPDKVAFQVGRLNQLTEILNDIEYNSGKHLQVIVFIQIKEKKK